MKRGIILFGVSNVIDTSDIVEIEQKNLTFKIEKSKKNPEPKPDGFWARMSYSETIYYEEIKNFSCIILKVKGGTQLRGKVDEYGNFSGYNNQLYDFYTIYNDKELVDVVKNNKARLCEIGNFYAYPGILNYSDYTETNMLFDSSIKTKEDFIKNYLE